MRDAIVASGWTWEASNVTERVASALARAGSRVLYCENPAFFLRTVRPFSELEKGVFAFGLQHVGHRLNSFPILQRFQAKLLAAEILNAAARLQLNNPVFIYPHADYCLPLCREFKRRGFQLIHICMDYELDLVAEHVRESDLALIIPRVAFEKLREEFGAKVRKIPQFSYVDESGGQTTPGLLESSELSTIPKPRLGHLGGLAGRLSLPLLRETLARHPEWQFISFDSEKRLGLPNEHILPWRSREDLGSILAGLNVGFMPYDCTTLKNLHCVPLKLFDYFALGMPVVSTPIIFLQEYDRRADDRHPEGKVIKKFQRYAVQILEGCAVIGHETHIQTCQDAAEIFSRPPGQYVLVGQAQPLLTIKRNELPLWVSGKRFPEQGEREPPCQTSQMAQPRLRYC